MGGGVFKTSPQGSEKWGVNLPPQGSELQINRSRCKQRNLESGKSANSLQGKAGEKSGGKTGELQGKSAGKGKSGKSDENVAREICEIWREI